VLRRELPRIPPPADADTFTRLAALGEQLGRLHLGYETHAPYPLEQVWTPGKPPIPRIDGKMRLVRAKAGKREKAAAGTPDAASVAAAPDAAPVAVRVSAAPVAVRVSAALTLAGIPAEALGYTLGGRSALEWVLDQYAVKTDARSGIVSDANAYETETGLEPGAYAVDLVGRVVAVSLETVALVEQIAAVAV
jgi:predicted helicase